MSPPPPPTPPFAAPLHRILAGDTGVGGYGHHGRPISLTRSVAALYGISDAPVAATFGDDRSANDGASGDDNAGSAVTPADQMQVLLQRQRRDRDEARWRCEDALAVGVGPNKVSCITAAVREKDKREREREKDGVPEVHVHTLALG